MSWIPNGLGRLLNNGEPTAQQRPSAAAAATSPTRSSRAPSNLTQTEKQPSPRSRAEHCSGSQQETAARRRSSEQQQLVEGPGSVYSLLPCIKQLRPSRGAADHLAAAVLGALPGVRLDSSWVVYPSGPQKSGPQKAEACICILPDLQPPGYFCSTTAVITFLRQLRDSGVSMPGVLHQQPPAPASPASAQRHTAAITAALLSCGAAFQFLEATDSVRDSSGSDEADMTAEGGTESNQHQQMQEKQQKRAGVKRSRELQQLLECQQQQDSLMTGAAPQSAAAAEAGQLQRGPKRRRSSQSQGGSSINGGSSGGSQPPAHAMSIDVDLASTAPAAAADDDNGPAAAAAGTVGTSEDAAGAAAAAGLAGRGDTSPSSGSRRSRRSSGADTAATQRAHEAASALLQSLKSPHGQQQLQEANVGRWHGADEVTQGLQQSAQGSDASGVPLGNAGGGGAVGGEHDSAAAADAAAAAVTAADMPAAAGGSLLHDSAAGAAAAATAVAPTAVAEAPGAGPAGNVTQQDAGSGDSAQQGSAPDMCEWQVIHRLQSLRSAAAFVTGQVKLNRVDAKLDSIRRAALVLGRAPSMSVEMAAPRAPKPPKAPSPVSAAAALSKPYAVDHKPRLPPKPRLSSSGGGAGGSGGSSRRPAATNTFTAASDVKAMSKLDSLLRAKEAAAAIKAAVQSGLPYEGTVQQRHHAMRQQLRQQLPDGRVPCAEGLSLLQELLSAQLPGARLDSEWLVYPATPQDCVPKLDILIRHPKITLGYFRSYKSVVTFYSSLTQLLKNPRTVGANYYNSKELLVPGLSMLPDALPQQHRQGCSPGELTTLMTKALSGVGRSFVKEAGAAAAGGGGSPVERGCSPGSSGGGPGYPAGGAKAAAANAAAVAARQWQPPPLVANLPPPRKGSPVLVLGMFYASEATAMESHNGLAQYRDRIRLCALHKQLGYIPHSFDRDHEAELAETAVAEGGKTFTLHVQGNFNSKRGAAAVADRFPDTRFTAVLLDYFRMPSGYAGDIYKSQLFLDYIPELVRRGNLPAGVPIYIPNSPVLLEQLAASGAFADYGDVVAIPARSYPLFEATRHVESTGQMPAKYSNVGQVRELVPGAEFIVVHYCGDATPSG